MGPHPPSRPRPAAPSASHRIRHRSHHHFWLNFPATLTVACSALEAQAPTVPPARPCRWSRCAVGQSSRGGPRGQGSGQVERGHTSADSRASQAARAAAAPCSSSGNVQRWSPRSRNPSDPRPQSLGLLEGGSLLNAAPAKTCDLHVTYGVP